MIFHVAARDDQGNLVSRNISEFGDLSMKVIETSNNSTYSVPRYSVRLNDKYIDVNAYESKEDAEVRLMVLNDAINKWSSPDE